MVVAHHRTHRRPSAGFGPEAGAAGSTVIPYDYAAVFPLTGIPGNIVQDVIAISADGPFVAVAIGYGYQQDRSRAMSLGLSHAAAPGDVLLSQLPPAALIQGFRVNPRSKNLMFEGDVEQAENDAHREYSDQQISPELLDKVFELMLPPQDISFLFSLVDSGSGRELQDQPAHNLASLGVSTGQRPFRPLARPLTFLPRSTVRVQIVERSPDALGRLFIVLYGYKALVGSACPEPTARFIAAAVNSRTGVPQADSSRVIPFDYVAKVTLTGRPGNPLFDEVPINVDGGYVATAIGYGLAVEPAAFAFNRVDASGTPNLVDPLGNPIVSPADNSPINLRSVPVKALPSDALCMGIRVRPEYLRIVFDGSGQLNPSIRLNVAEQAFEELNQPDDVSFLYKISDTGVGRDWQNIPIHSVAGLGIGNGLRPFKKFARPRIFPPRSTINVSVEEYFGRGTLFFAFQGYKLVGGVGVRS